MRDYQLGRELPGEVNVRKVRNEAGQVEVTATLPVEWPEGYAYLRDWFDFLSDQREVGAQGFPQRLKLSEIEAGLRLLGEDPGTWELRALTTMDAAYCNALSGEMVADMKRHLKG